MNRRPFTVRARGNWTRQPMKAKDLPEFRARTIRDFQAAASDQAARHDLARRVVRAGGTTKLDADNAEAHADIANAKAQLVEATYGTPDMLRCWQLADLYYVAEEMSALASGVTQSMPGFNLHPDDLPSPHGVIYLAGAQLREYDIVSIWAPDYDHHAPGVLFVSYAVKPNDLLLLHQTNIPYGADEIDGSDGVVRWARVVRCCWLLMQQRIAAQTTERPDRAAARRMQRAGQPIDAVRVITLRHQAHTGDGHSDREYIHRWIVRAHWRRQWYPSQNRHIPILIAPYIKGPDDAPILHGEKVYAWTR